MEAAINEALTGMGVDHVDIFHLHAAKEGPDLFEKRKGAVECLKDYKKKGIIKFIGTSTHNIELVKSLADKDFIDVVFPLINREGRGVIGGNTEDMQKAIAGCAQNGKGIYLMKVLGGGALIDSYEKSMDFGRSLDENYSIAVGMISKEEVLYNVKYFNDERDLQDIIKIRNKKQVRISPHMCMSCGVCINTCHNDAISVDINGKSVIDPSKCLQCGYCLAACPHFAIRVI
jgi:predicted aldo/keto reductase-like oxidoreductase